jgi:hypothetical protein
MTVNKTTAAAIAAVGGEPIDPLWEWLALYGPHGDRFTWSQTRREPADMSVLSIWRRSSLSARLTNRATERV